LTEGWVFDLDGVLWRGAEPVPGAAAAVAQLQRGGAEVLFVTNMSGNPARSVEQRLEDLGVDAAGRVVTSAMAAARLVEPGERVHACAGLGVVEELEARGATVVTGGRADTVIVGYHREFDYERLTGAMRAVRAGARLIGTNDDATYPTDEGLLPGNGALLAAVATASQVAPVVAGKPHEPMCALVRDRLGAKGIVVGDRADTDGGFARALGYRFALVLSGVTTEADLPVDPEPVVVGADAADVLQRLDVLSSGA
jgi:HAD superfamily hydrolase (TIGR01450 family)